MESKSASAAAAAPILLISFNWTIFSAVLQVRPGLPNVNLLGLEGTTGAELLHAGCLPVTKTTASSTERCM